MAVALRSGIPADVWLDDTNALVTAVDIYDEIDRKR